MPAVAAPAADKTALQLLTEVPALQYCEGQEGGACHQNVPGLAMGANGRLGVARCCDCYGLVVGPNGGGIHSYGLGFNGDSLFYRS